MASIQVIQGPDKGRTFGLHDGRNVVGRQSGGVELTDETISRQHFQLTRRDDGTWVVEDLGSANGTLLNGMKIKSASTVKQGDQIRCGSSLLVFSHTGGAAPVTIPSLDIDEDGMLVDAAIVATVPSNEDSVIMPTPEAGAEAVENVRILYNLVAEVSSIFKVDELLKHTLERVMETVTADRGYILLIDESGELTVMASKQADNSGKEEIPISRTIIHEVVTNEVGVQSTNAMSDKRFHSGKSVHDFGIRSAMCVPIKGRERILGVIHVDCSISDHTYSSEQLRLLTAIGYQTGLAVENVALHDAAVQSERLTAVGETVARLSHHIKNILQALSAGTDVVEAGLRRSDLAAARNAWPIVHRSLGRINNLILNMLAFSKDRRPLVENTDLGQVLRECLELVTAQADERNVALMSDVGESRPIPADPAGLRQAFLNLLTNALDAVPDNAGVITVSSRYDSMNRNVVVQIIDNGGGIPGDRRASVFTAFYSDKGQTGTGLGLAVTKKIIEEHHGRIKVDSKDGEGSTFTVTLPAIRRSLDDTHFPNGT